MLQNIPHSNSVKGISRQINILNIAVNYFNLVILACEI